MTATNGDHVRRLREAMEAWAARTAPLIARETDPDAIRRILRDGLAAELADLGLDDEARPA